MFYGYSSISKDPEYINIYIDLTFLENLKIKNYYTIPKNCDVKLMLLQMEILKSDVLKREVFELKITVENTEISMNTILKEVSRRGNIDLYFWYQHIVINVILKLICVKTISMLKQEFFDEYTLIKHFRNISIFYSEILNMPSKLRECFNELSSKTLKRYEKYEIIYDLTDYINSNIFENTYFSFPNVNIILDHKNDDGSTFDKFMTELIKSINAFKCLISINHFLSNEYDKYYDIHTIKPNKLFQIVTKLLIVINKMRTPKRKMYMNLTYKKQFLAQ